ncbi:MAG: hypothetical protein HN404_03010 [Gemmatimonadetes bacterium]|nr:hypothetical protein [Gemmatimonadota bacterium]
MTSTDTDAPVPARGRSARGSGVTFRSLLTGTILAICISTGAPYGNMVLRGSYMALDFSTAGAIFVFFLLVFLVHTGLGLISSNLAFRPEELVVVYIMSIVSCSIPTMGLTEYLLPILGGAHYYATPENEWAVLIHPYIKSWMVPQEFTAVKNFYEGSPRGVGIAWESWALPLLTWIPMILSIYFSMACIMVILRKQWIVRERLAFPLIQVPLAMTEDDGSGRALKPFFRNWLMWVGFSLPFFVGSLKALHNYFNFIPTVVTQTSIPLFRNTAVLQIALSFPMLGFSYLVNTDIAFSIWFFSLVMRAQEGIFGVLGISSPEKLYYAPPEPIVAHQGMGAFIVMVLFGLWTARDHLSDVFRKAFKGDDTVDDSEEMMSYRFAVFGLLLANVFIGMWLWTAGMEFWVVPIYLGTMYLVFLAVTRLVAEGGIAAARAPLIPSDFVSSSLGNSVLGPSTLVALGFTHVWASDIRTFVMASTANGLKLAEEQLQKNKRSLFWAIGLSIVVSIAASVWAVMEMSYGYGGINLNGWFFGPAGGPSYPWTYATGELNNPDGPDTVGWIATGVGGSVMGLLMLARHHFLWWPMHPLGFAVSTISMTNYLTLSVFLAWLIKSIILKYGGPTLFHRARPFFLGMILGQFFVAGLWLVIDFFTGMTDNNIYWV